MRILKRALPGRALLFFVLGSRGIDPYEDTETPLWWLALASGFVLRSRGIDPYEDTETRSTVISAWEKGASSRGIDPYEDTETEFRHDGCLHRIKVAGASIRMRILKLEMANARFRLIPL